MHHSRACDKHSVSAAKTGILATGAMELFLRATDPMVKHKVNSAWMQGTALGLPPKAKTTLIPGYLIYISGGIAFSYLYQQFVPKKTATTGIVYALIFPLSFIGGLIMMPIMGAVHPLAKKNVIPKPGVFGLGLGAKAFLFTALGHIVYGATLGSLYRRQPSAGSSAFTCSSSKEFAPPQYGSGNRWFLVKHIH